MAIHKQTKKAIENLASRREAMIVGWQRWPQLSDLTRLNRLSRLVSLLVNELGSAVEPTSERSLTDATDKTGKTIANSMCPSSPLAFAKIVHLARFTHM